MHKTNKGFAVIGTDTGVGKTMLTALLCLSAQQAGVDWVPMKPVQTGGDRLPDGRISAPDLDWILSVLGLAPTPEDRIRMNPYAFELAASPHLAAELGGHQIDRRLILEAYAALSAGHEGVIVEGAGGLLVPFGRYWTLADLLVDLHLPVIVVARAGLGTLNHTLLTLEALRARRLEVAGVVLNQLTSQAAGVIEADNVKVITDIGGAPVWGTMPHWERRDGELESVALCSRLVQMPELLSHVSPYLWPKVHTEM